MGDRMHVAAVGIEPRRLVDDDGAIFPRALEQLVGEIEEILRHGIALVMRQLPRAEQVGHHGAAGRHDIPADAAAR